MASKITFTQGLIDELRFDRQPVVRRGKISWKLTRAGTHDWFVQDAETSGLMVRLTPTSATWIVRRKLNGRTTRRAMGSIRTGEAGEYLSLAQARRRCEAWRGLMAEGRDPLLERKKVAAATAAETDRQRNTMRRAFAEYLAVKRATSAAATTRDREKVGKWLEGSPLWGCPVSEVTGDIVRSTFQPLLDLAYERRVKRPRWGPKRPSGSVTKRMYIYARKAWQREATRQHLAGDPFREWKQDAKWPQAKIRTRRLDTSSDGGERWIRALIETWKSGHEAETNAPMVSLLADYYILVLLWGTRLTETCSLEWRQVDQERGIVWLQPETTKTRRLGALPITAWAEQILRLRRVANEQWRPGEPWVFPSPVHGRHLSNPRKALDRLAVQTGVRIATHDLRRTLASDLGAESHLAEAQALTLAGAALQHASGSLVTQDYMRSKVEILRPIYQRRENRLRAIAGLPPLGKTPPTAADDALDQIVADPEMRKRLLAKLLAAGTP